MGHNGAGKTTTFSVLSGITSCSSGRVLICRENVATNLAFCQQNIGYCPQYNPLFDKLTVREHLQLYAQLKGCKRKLGHQLNKDIRRLTNSVGLDNKLNIVSFDF